MVALVALGAASAGAQSVHSRKAGVIGGDPGALEADTSELDACEGAVKDDDRVSEHWDRGSILFEQGDYRRAIAEFVAAYCHGGGQYPSILLDIAKSFERVVDYEKAVAYLERYISEAPDSERQHRDRTANRAAVLRALPAKIRVATEPPGASVTVVGDTGVAAQARADDEVIEVRKGIYELRVELPGHQPLTHQLVAQIGQPYSFYFRLEPQKGTVRVFAGAADARIFVDRRLVGIGNYVETLPIGSYELTVEAPGRDPVTRPFEVSAGQTTDVTIELPARPKSGRRELITASTVGGAVFGGLALVTVFEDNTLAGSSGVLIGAAIGFGGSYFGVPEDTTVGTSSYVIGGTIVGAAEGALVALTICGDSCGDDTVSGIALASGVLGLGVTAGTAGRLNLSAGDAALLNSGAMWGSLTSLMFLEVFDASDDSVSDPLLLVGLNLGLLAGASVASRVEYSRGHVALIDLSGLAGIIAGVSLASAFPESSEGSERTAHFALGGMTLGLITGAYLLRDRDEPKTLRPLKPAAGAALDIRGEPVVTYGMHLTW